MTAIIMYKVGNEIKNKYLFGNIKNIEYTTLNRLNNDQVKFWEEKRNKKSQLPKNFNR